MAYLQKILNLVVIAAFIVFIIHFNSEISSVSPYQSQIIELVTKIGQAKQLNPEENAMIKRIANIAYRDDENDGFRCLLSAYHHLVLDKMIDVGQLFQIFSEPRGQYNNVHYCTHYLSLLLYRAETSSTLGDRKVEIVQYLNKRLGEQFQENYKGEQGDKQVKQEHICVFNYGRNGESTIKRQVLSLFNQDYKETTMHIEPDGSTDNTYMFSKFTIEQKGKASQQKIQIDYNTKTEGFLQRLKSFTTDICKQNSIVLLLENDQILLSSQVFKLVNLVFQSQTIKVATFNTFTINHTNIHRHPLPSSQHPDIRPSQLYPIVSIRRLSLLASINQFEADIGLDKIKNIQFQYLIFLKTLIKNGAIQPSQVLEVEEAVGYRGQRSRLMDIRLVEQIANY